MRIPCCDVRTDTSSCLTRWTERMENIKVKRFQISLLEVSYTENTFTNNNIPSTKMIYFYFLEIF